MDKKEPGYVYIMTKTSFHEGRVIIGKRSRPVNVRSKERDNTDVPHPFVIYATLQTENHDKENILMK